MTLAKGFSPTWGGGFRGTVAASTYSPPAFSQESPLKIALMGSAPSSRELGPFNDPDWEIWSCSPPNYDLPRVDAWFELHLLDRKMSTAANRPYIETIMQHPRVYVAKKDPRFPKAIEYPMQEMVDLYGRYFFTSSLAWMFALAITCKPEKIGLWGVDMSAAEEYGYQRAGCHYFIQKARDAGIGVYAPGQSDILNPIPLYGFKEQTRMWAKQKARRHELEQRYHAAKQSVEKGEREMLIFQGALDDMQYVDHTYDPMAFEENFAEKQQVYYVAHPPTGNETDGKDTDKRSLPGAKKPRRSSSRSRPK